MTVGFLGLSHLGLVSAAAAAAKGYDVVGFDESAAHVERLRRGELTVVEPGLAELIAAAGARLRLTSDPGDLETCELLYVSVDVPTDEHDASDPAPVERLLLVAAEQAPAGACVVVLSQVEPGFTRAQRGRVERDGRVLCYQVETLVFGRAVERALEPERFIVGVADSVIPERLRAHLEAFGCPILAMGYESAELCKIAINAFLVSSISTTNTLAELSEAIGADWAEITPALRLDRRIGEHAYLGAGLGFGGSNLSRDLATIERLARATGVDAGVVAAWRAHSVHRRAWPLRVLHERLLGRTARPRVAIWGLAYKEDTQSTRNSPGLALATTLAAAGTEVAAYDPEAEPVTIVSPSFRRVDDPFEACADADALVLATPWRSFRDSEPAAIADALEGRLVVDPYGLLDAGRMAAVGLEHARLGVPLPKVSGC
ncbi:MAG TPA: nucleotide sugar dehydrogenase [Plantibacter sp.]|uniref:nucleotide sugar dehydrogenase n=1 Tax=Plantibacter sp. TaxID=1871045 RepID=UPI002C22769F|nr:nucleotide sugar dehydrogenase [Plantibacter sp.]